MHASSFQLLTNFSGLVFVEATFGEVGRVDLDGTNELLVGNLLLGFSENFEENSASVLERATVLVRTVVDSGAEELAEEVAVLCGGSVTDFSAND